MRVNEQVATVRLLLRRTYARAGKDIHTGEYVRLVDLYSQGCMRLARLGKQCGSENERVGEFLRRSFHEGARQMLEQAGWEVEGGT